MAHRNGDEEDDELTMFPPGVGVSQKFGTL